MVKAFRAHNAPVLINTLTLGLDPSLREDHSILVIAQGVRILGSLLVTGQESAIETLLDEIFALKQERDRYKNAFDEAWRVLEKYR